MSNCKMIILIKIYVRQVIYYYLDLCFNENYVRCAFWVQEGIKYKDHSAVVLESIRTMQKPGLFVFV